MWSGKIWCVLSFYLLALCTTLRDSTWSFLCSSSKKNERMNFREIFLNSMTALTYGLTFLTNRSILLRGWLSLAVTPKHFHTLDVPHEFLKYPLYCRYHPSMSKTWLEKVNWETRRAQGERQMMLGWSRPVRLREVVTEKCLMSRWLCRAKIRAWGDAWRGEALPGVDDWTWPLSFAPCDGGRECDGHCVTEILVSWFVSSCKQQSIRHVSACFFCRPLLRPIFPAWE